MLLGHPIERETRTTGGGGGWHNTPPSIARREQRARLMGANAHTHRTRDANDGRRWWLEQHTPIERETRTTGGGGGWSNTPPSIARRERRARLMGANAHPHRLRDANDVCWPHRSREVPPPPPPTPRALATTNHFPFLGSPFSSCRIHLLLRALWAPYLGRSSCWVPIQVLR